MDTREIRQAADKIAIAEVFYRYGWGIDTKSEEVLADCFTATGVLDFGKGKTRTGGGKEKAIAKDKSGCGESRPCCPGWF